MCIVIRCFMIRSSFGAILKSFEIASVCTYGDSLIDHDAQCGKLARTVSSYAAEPLLQKRQEPEQ